MAFTRKALKELGLPDEHVDKVMTLHGTSMADYVPKSEVDTQVQQALGGADIKDLTTKASRVDVLEQELANTHRDHGIEGFLKGKGITGAGALKAAKSLFDMSVVEHKDGVTTGLDKLEAQYAEIIKDESVSSIFGAAPTPPAPAPTPGKPQFGTEPAGGITPPSGGAVPDADKIAEIFKN